MSHEDPASAPDPSAPDELSEPAAVGSEGGDGAADRSSSRRAFLRRAALLGGVAATTGGIVTALPDDGDSAASAAQDARILNYVLRLERLKAAFYEEAAQGGDLTGELRQLARVLGRHERRHVVWLERRLGERAHDARSYDFGDATSDPDAFAEAARMLEEVAVAAFIGQGANLTRRHMVPFAQITSVEARHAAWIANILQQDPAPGAADEAKTPREVVAEIERTGFEVS